MYKILIALLILLMPCSVFADELDKTKRIVKSFALTENTYVEVDNKYGNIEVETWDKDSIKFEIEIIVHSDKEDELEEMLGLVKIDLKASSAFVIAETMWSEDIGLWKKGILKINQEVKSNARYNINYKIYLPDGVDLSLTNKFGDIFMSVYTGKLNINISYGDIRAHRLSNVKQIDAKYGKVKIKNLPYGRLTLGSVKSFSVEKSAELEIESSSSEIEIGEINELNIKSSHDDLSIERINALSGSFSMSDVVLDELNTKVKTTSKYGSLKIKSIDSECESIIVKATKTDVSLYYTFGFNANVNVALSDKANFTFNSSFSETSGDYDSNSIYRAKGSIHDGGGSEVNIESINGYIELESK